jgi:protein-tyrosine phosphatase
VFDERHRDAITRVLDYRHWNRIVLFNKIALDEDGNVEDPHYQTAAVYRRVARHIENGCKRLVEQWKLQPPKPEG